MKIAKNLTLMMKPKMTPVKVSLKKMKSEQCVMNAVNTGSYVALYSSDSFEMLFVVCY